MRRKQAIEALDRLWLPRSGRLSWQVLHEVYWNAVRKMNADRDLVRRQVELFEGWQPIAADGTLIRRAWVWEADAGVSFWDAMIIAAELSEDLQTSRRLGDVEVVNPFV